MSSPFLPSASLPTRPGEVKGACPHDCPDTCSLITTVENGVAAQGARQSRAPADPRRAVHQGVALHRAHLPPGTRAAPAQAIGAQGLRALRTGELGRGARRHRAAAAGDRGRSIPRPSFRTAMRAPWAWCRARAWPLASSTSSGASLLDRTICSSAGTEGLIHTLGGKVGHEGGVLRRIEADPDLGQQFDRQQPAFLAPRAGSQATRRQAGVHRSAPHRNRRQMP